MEDKEAGGAEPPKKKVSARKKPDYFDMAARGFIQRAMTAKEWDFEVLDGKLRERGFGSHSGPRALRQRVMRGTFSAGFFIQLLNVLEARVFDPSKDVDGKTYQANREHTLEYEKASKARAKRNRDLKAALAAAQKKG